MEISILWEIVILSISLLLSAYFSSMETSFSLLSEVKIKQLFTYEKLDENMAKTLLISRRNRILNTILLGNTLFNIICVFIIIDIANKY
mgnify:FL=1